MGDLGSKGRCSGDSVRSAAIESHKVVVKHIFRIFLVIYTALNVMAHLPATITQLCESRDYINVVTALTQIFPERIAIARSRTTGQKLQGSSIGTEEISDPLDAYFPTIRNTGGGLAIEHLSLRSIQSRYSASQRGRKMKSVVLI